MLWELTSIWSGQYRVNASIGDGDPRVLPDRGGIKRVPFDDETYENPPYARVRHSWEHSNFWLNVIWHGKLARGKHDVSAIQKSF